MVVFSFLLYDFRVRGGDSFVRRGLTRMGIGGALSDAFASIALRAALGLGAFGIMYLAYQYYGSYRRTLDLERFISELATVSDKTEELVKARERLEEMEICHQIHLDELLRKGVARIREGGIECD